MRKLTVIISLVLMMSETVLAQDAVSFSVLRDRVRNGFTEVTEDLFIEGMLINKFAVYDYKPAENQGTMAGVYNYNAVMDVQWPFGHGLSYTTFAYSDMTVSAEEFDADDVIKVTVNVTNTGNVTGKESVLLFSTDLYASSTPDVRRLRAFDKVTLAPGETKTVEFELAATDLAFVDYYGRWTLEEGDFVLSCGSEAYGIYCTETTLWDTPNID